MWLSSRAEQLHRRMPSKAPKQFLGLSRLLKRTLWRLILKRRRLSWKMMRFTWPGSDTLVAKADKSVPAMGAANLSARDEICILLDEISASKNVVTSYESWVTRLVASIYASESPSLQRVCDLNERPILLVFWAC